MATAHPSPCANRRRSDTGFTFVEVCVSIVLMGVVSAAILPAMWTAVRASRISATQAEIEAVLGRAVDHLANQAYVACPTLQNTYQARVEQAALELNWPASSVTIVQIRYWDARRHRWSTTNPAEAAGCVKSGSFTKEATLQKITVVATSPNGAISKRVELVIGDVRTDDLVDQT